MNINMRKNKKNNCIDCVWHGRKNHAKPCMACHGMNEFYCLKHDEELMQGDGFVYSVCSKCGTSLD